MVPAGWAHHAKGGEIGPENGGSTPIDRGGPARGPGTRDEEEARAVTGENSFDP